MRNIHAFRRYRYLLGRGFGNGGLCHYIQQSAVILNVFLITGSNADDMLHFCYQHMCAVQRMKMKCFLRHPVF